MILFFFQKILLFFQILFASIQNILYRNSIYKSIRADFDKCMRNESFLDRLLETFLRLLSIVFLVNPHFRKHIEGFHGRYSFKSMDGKISIGAEFKNSRLYVFSGSLKHSNVTVMFKDSRSLKEFLFSPNPDILGGMLDNKLHYEGNLNYLLRFGYIINHLKTSLNLSAS